MITKLNGFNELQLSKSNAVTVAQEFVSEVVDGSIEPLQAYIRIQWLQDVLKNASDSIKGQALNEAEKYGKSFTRENGVKVEIRETGVKYDFSEDKEWQEYEDNIKTIKALQKGRETSLKALNLAPKTSTTSVVLTFPK